MQLISNYLCSSCDMSNEFLFLLLINLILGFSYSLTAIYTVGDNIIKLNL